MVPIAKPAKNPKNPTNYSPIALTSCLCKTMERMVSVRLMWCLESEVIYQTSSVIFVRTVPLLITLHYLRLCEKSCYHERTCYSIFFNLENMFDTTSKHGILRDLHELSFRGRLPNFISNFVSDRLFQVKIGSILSDFNVQDNGVPRCSILSPVLFNIRMRYSQNRSLFVDHFDLCLRGRSLPSVIRRLQLSVNNVSK